MAMRIISITLLSAAASLIRRLPSGRAWRLEAALVVASIKSDDIPPAIFFADGIGFCRASVRSDRASSGIGEAAAVMLAGRGAKVVLGARGLDRLEALARRIAGARGEVAYAQTDEKALRP
jgi:hypothetical protein